MNRQWITITIVITTVITIHISSSTSVIPSDHLLPPPLHKKLTHNKQPPLLHHNQNPSVPHENSEPPGFMSRIARWFGIGSPAKEQQLQSAASYQYSQYKNAPPMGKHIGYPHPHLHQNQQYVSSGNDKASCGLCNKFPWVPVFPESIQLPIANFYKQQHWNQPEQQPSQYHQQFHPPSNSIPSQQPLLVQRAIKFDYPSKSVHASVPPPPKRGNRQNFNPQNNRQQTNFIPIPVPNLSPTAIPPLYNAQPFRPITQKTDNNHLPLKAEASSFIENHRTSSNQHQALPTQIPPTQLDTQYSNSDSTFEIVKSHQITDFVSSVEYPANFVQSQIIDIPDSTKNIQTQTQEPSTQNPSETLVTQTKQTMQYSSDYTAQPPDPLANTIDYQRGFSNIHQNNQDAVVLTELGSFDYSHYDQYTPSPESLSTLPISGSVFGETIDSTDPHSDPFEVHPIVIPQNLNQNEIFYAESDNFPSASSHNLTSVQQDNHLETIDSIQQHSSAENFLNQEMTGNIDLTYASTPVPTTIQPTKFVPEYIHQTIVDVAPSIGTTLTKKSQQDILKVINEQREEQKRQEAEIQQKDVQRQQNQHIEQQQQQWLEQQQEKQQQEEQKRLQEQKLYEDQLKLQELQRQEEQNRQQEQLRQLEEIQRQQELQRQQQEKQKREQQEAERQLEQRRQREQQQRQKYQEKLNRQRLQKQQQQQVKLPKDRETPKSLLDSPIHYNWNIHSSPRPFTRDPSELGFRSTSTQHLSQELLINPQVPSTHIPPITTPEDVSPTSIYSSTDASGQFAGMSPPQPPPRRQLHQVIIPYTTKNKPRPFELPTHRIPEAGGRYDTWSHANDFDVHEQQESKLVRTATEAPLSSKRTTKYLTKILATNLRELLKREHEIKNSSSFDFSRLQKNIDDWTEQEFTSLSHKPSTVSIRGRSKHIPTEYLTTSTPSMRQAKTTHFQNLPSFSTSINNLLTDRGSKRYEFPSFIDDQLSDYLETTPATKISTAATSSTPSYIKAISSTIKPRELWHQAKVSISPKTKEKVYVVTPMPRYVPQSLALTTTTTTEAPNVDEPSSVGSFKSPRFLVRPTPAIGFTNTTTTTNSPQFLYTPELFGLMGISAYIPPAPVETIDGHSKVITVVTPSNGSNRTVTDDFSRNHRLDDPVPVADQLSSNMEGGSLS